MTALVKFVLGIALVAGLVYGGMVALALFVEPTPREIVEIVPPSRFEK